MSFGSTTIESKFCVEINNALRSGDGYQLLSIVQLEPPFGPIHEQLIRSLQSTVKTQEQLETIVRNHVSETRESEDEEGRPVPNWNPMVIFVASWMIFIRDVDVTNLLSTYEGLADLQQKANSALQHSTKGILILPTVISYAKVFSRVAIGLDKRPELIEHLISNTISEEGRRESLPEKAANILRNAFITCLNDRNTAPRGIKDGRPDGKKVGIYKMANICLRILFQCEKLENCQTFFSNIQNSSPPLHIYPASERVTYLYYLGRSNFATTDFYEAQLCLQRAYDEASTHPACTSQRRLILIYLITANLLLGRLPGPHIYNRPEARGLHARFDPLARAIRKGDLESYRRITNLDLSYEHTKWYLRYRIFYQLGNYCEVYVWRSLFRRVFLLTGQQGTSERSAPTIDLNAVLAAFLYLEKRAHMSPSMAQADSVPGRRHITFALADMTPPASAGYIDPDFDGVEGLVPYIPTRTPMEIESICSSLILQGFLQGYISHEKQKFAITGSRRVGALKAGFPVIWEVIRKGQRDTVLGWKMDSTEAGGGTVVRLSGARPAGS
jgi:nuclear mRNA export protein PCID2/THP1